LGVRFALELTPPALRTPFLKQLVACLKILCLSRPPLHVYSRDLAQIQGLAVMKHTFFATLALLGALPAVADTLPLGLSYQEFESVAQMKVGAQTMQVELVDPTDKYAGTKLLFDGKELARTDGDMMKLEYQFELPTSKVVLVSEYSGGNACPANYRLVQINKTGRVATTKVFGNCSDVPTVRVEGERITMTLPAEEGKRIIEEKWVFENGVLTEPRKRAVRSK
jgi:hypothetical protein